MTSETVDRIALIRRVADRWAIADDAETRLVGGQLLEWLTFELTAEEAFGLPCSWRRAVRLHTRDLAIRQIAHLYPDGLSERDLAIMIAADWGAYETTGWLRDGPAARRPAGKAGSFYDLLVITRPIRWEAIRKILRG